MDLDLIVITALVCVVNLPVYYLLYRLCFGDFETLVESLKYSLKPDIISWFQGEGWDDMAAEFRLAFFLIGCGLLIFGEIVLVRRLSG